MNEHLQDLSARLGVLNSESNYDPVKRIPLLTGLAWDLRHTDMQKSRPFAHEALALLEQQDNSRERTQCYATLAELYERQGDGHKALEFSQLAADLAEREGLEFFLPFVLSTQGGAKWRLGCLTDALACFRKQYRISLKLGDAANEAEALNNIALIHSEYGDSLTAKRAMKEALQMYIALDDRAGQALVMNNQAMIGVEAGSLSEALPLAQRALELARTSGHQPFQMTALDTLGLIYSGQGRYQQATSFFQDIIQLSEITGCLITKATSLLELGQILASQGHVPGALEHLHRALNFLKETNHKKRLYECHQALARIYETEGKLTESIYHLKLYYALKELIYYDKSGSRGQQLVMLQTGEQLPGITASASRPLQAILTICSNCKGVRDEKKKWHFLETYLSKYTGLRVSHGICPECMHHLYSDLLEGE